MHAFGQGRSLAAKWELHELCALHAVGVRSFAGYPRMVISIAFEGACVGDPPEETIGFAFWTPQSNRGVVGAPQVLST